MPTYVFSDDKTGEVTEHFMTLSEYDEFVKNNPHLRQEPAKPIIGYNYSQGMKPDGHFRDKLREIKKAHRNSTVNDF